MQETRVSSKSGAIVNKYRIDLSVNLGDMLYYISMEQMAKLIVVNFISVLLRRSFVDFLLFILCLDNFYSCVL